MVITGDYEKSRQALDSVHSIIALVGSIPGSGKPALKLSLPPSVRYPLRGRLYLEVTEIVPLGVAESGALYAVRIVEAGPEREIVQAEVTVGAGLLGDVAANVAVRVIGGNWS